MPPPPPRIFIRIHIRRPIIQPGHARIRKGPRLGTDHICDLVHQLVVKRRSDSNRIRKRRRISESTPAAPVEAHARGRGYPVQRFVPPGVGGEGEARGPERHAIFMSAHHSEVGMVSWVFDEGRDAVLNEVGQLLGDVHGLDECCRPNWGGSGGIAYWIGGKGSVDAVGVLKSSYCNSEGAR